MALQDYLVPNNSKANICFDCQNACGKCSWSRNFTPVPGWTAETKYILNGKDYYGKPRFEQTYYISDCPEFVPDDKRNGCNGEFSEKQIRMLVQHWRRRGEL